MSPRRRVKSGTAESGRPATMDEEKGSPLSIQARNWKAEFETHLRNAEGGDPEAMFLLGCCFRDGVGVPFSRDKAGLYSLRAAKVGSEVARGVCAEFGYGEPLDLVKAARHYQSAAAAGDRWGYHRLGRAHAKGSGLAKNSQQAIDCLKKAASLGVTQGFRDLAKFFLEQDPKRSFRCSELGAMAGDPEAMHQLVVCYSAGRGVRKDDVMAVAWLKAAIEHGQDVMMFNLAYVQYLMGLCHEQGIVVKADPELALSWYRRAADQGSASAACRIGVHYQRGRGVPIDDYQAAQWFRRAADQGCPYAQWHMARLYEHGQGVVKDENESARYDQLAAKQGHPESISELLLKSDSVLTFHTVHVD